MEKLEILSPEVILFLTSIIGLSALFLCVGLWRSGAQSSGSKLAQVITLSAISSVICVIYVLFDGGDVALTEAAVNACLSTIFLLICVSFLESGKGDIPSSKGSSSYALIVCAGFALAAILIIAYGLDSMIGEFGNIDNAINHGATKYYLANTGRDIGIPAFITAILADYRGFDTFCETFVIFIAGIAVRAILSIESSAKVAGERSGSDELEEGLYAKN